MYRGKIKAINEVMAMMKQKGFANVGTLDNRYALHVLNVYLMTCESKQEEYSKQVEQEMSEARARVNEYASNHGLDQEDLMYTSRFTLTDRGKISVTDYEGCDGYILPLDKKTLTFIKDMKLLHEVYVSREIMRMLEK